jgi:hypothetical protein
MKTRLRSTVAAVMLLGPLAATFVAEPAAAQQRGTVAAPQITNMSVNSDAGLTPGATLRFQVYATPNARRASVTLGDSRITVPLRQQTHGNYTGSYVVRRSDRIDPTQLITARVQVGERSYARQFNYPPAFQALAMGAAPAQQAAIERFVMRPMGRLEPGRELRFRLVGRPGGDAWMDIPGVIRGVDLGEVRPGVYEGTYTVRRRDDLDAFERAVATLQHGEQRSTARVDLRGGDREFGRAERDERAPQISDLTPDNGENVRERNNTRISARVSDDGSGIDADSVRLRLNGRDVTADTRVNDDRVVFRDDLEPGRYTAELTVRDRAGNSSTKAWTFDVSGDRNIGSGPLPLQVTSHSNNMVVDASGNLAIRGRTAPNATVRVQVDSVATAAGMLSVAQPVLDQTVQADRNGHFGVTASPRGHFFPGTRYDVRVTSTSGAQTAEERLTLIQRQG